MRFGYNVYYSIDSKDARGGFYRANRSAMVLASTLQEGVVKFLAKYPDAKIDNVKHVGGFEVIE